MTGWGQFHGCLTQAIKFFALNSKTLSFWVPFSHFFQQQNRIGFDYKFMLCHEMKMSWNEQNEANLVTPFSESTSFWVSTCFKESHFYFYLQFIFILSEKKKKMGKEEKHQKWTKLYFHLLLGAHRKPKAGQNKQHNHIEHLT